MSSEIRTRLDLGNGLWSETVITIPPTISRTRLFFDDAKARKEPDEVSPPK